VSTPDKTLHDIDLTQNRFGHIFFKTLGKSLKPISNPITTEKQSFEKNVSKIIKPQYTSIFDEKTRIAEIFVDTSGFQNMSKTSLKNEMEPGLDRYQKIQRVQTRHPHYIMSGPDQLILNRTPFRGTFFSKPWENFQKSKSKHI